ncbi:MAG: dehydratase [Chloroflexi bacterium]|nr:dehydratase [Chloroflexota bacterium]
MKRQLYYEDVEAGMELPSVTKHPTTKQLVMYAGASGDFYQIHYDKDFAQGTGLPSVIIHGALKNAFLGQLLTDWIGEEGVLKKLSCQYRGMDFPGEPITCKGKVTEKYVKNGKRYVECEIWVENGRGEKTTPGNATVILPSRRGRP